MSINKLIKNKSIFNFVMFLQVITITSILLNIPIIRQISSFISITFIPGYLILKKLNMNFNDYYDYFITSISLSIFYLMLIGLSINFFLPIFNIFNPLSEFYIIFIFLLLNLVLSYINITNSNVVDSYNIINFINENKTTSFLTIFMFVINLLLNVFAYIYSYKITYLVLILNIVFLYIYIIYKFDEKNKNIYYLFIYMISFSLLLQTILTSKYIIGSDISIEYYVFQITKNNNYWNPFFFGPNVWIGIVDYNSMLSVTILPTIYSVFLNINDDFIFKIIYPFLLSLIPLMLIKTYNNYIKSFSYYSFLAGLFYLSDNTIFYGLEPLSLCKQIVAIFFMTAFFLILSMDNIKILNKKILLMIFGFSVNISHYSTAYIFLFIIIFSFILNKFIFKERTDLTLNIVLFIFSTKIIWDSFVTINTINQIYNMFSMAYIRFISDLLNPTTRNLELSLIYRSSTSTLYIIHRVIFYIVHILLSLGIMTIFVNRKENNIKNIYKIISLLCFSLIATVIFVPIISNWFGLSRFRWVSMLVLTPFIIIGYNLSIYLLFNITDIKLVNFKKFNFASYKHIYLSLISVILISYFLFNVGFINYSFNDKPLSFTFDSSRMETSTDPQIVSYYYAQYKPEWDVRSASWLSNNANSESIINSDYISAWHVLISHGLLNNERVNHFQNNTMLNEGEYIYLSYMNTVNNMISIFRTGTHNKRVLYNTSIFSPIFDVNNKIYSNGFSDIYLCIPNDSNIIVFKEEFLENLN